ncbi:PRC-barrel domain-containing protein [Rhodoplanes sp. TEM]|uniref:PRC-barrel domain-containing protein n=1 Tax=Rhodoplanes tepidamans TaxID=200616 RepID=A0ABT5JHC2_RHOTP|nr:MULTISPECIES: PRC-barrel domain-containing protein [Rhodoplanes]MDC7789115.1 PRC-barrel domain-containing protein [Rhodoplanes tepidamans]MDC7982732.1 PRC-barrel domain-containing protein [Rhodoplanes sp. TEM]MDQ0357439.1 sporulation protein YlmC with PRC-barrel domain [Rhodoplanes tepidamans]
MRHGLLVAAAVLTLGGGAVAQNAAPASPGSGTSGATGAQQRPATGSQAGQTPSGQAQTGQAQTGQAQPGQAGSGQAGTGQAASQPGLRAVDPAGSVRLSFYTVEATDMRVSKLMGAEVYNLDNESIGEVEDLILDGGKTIKAVVVSVGGFLGIGERNVALDPRSVVLTERGDGNARLVVNTTREDLKKAPPFDFAEVDRAGGRAETSGASGSGPALRPNADRGSSADQRERAGSGTAR